MDWLTGEVIATLAAGVAVTLVLTIITSALSLLIGVSVGTLRLSATATIRWPATAFVEVFRNVPALIQIIFWAFAVPNLLPIDLRRDLLFDNAVMDALGAVTGLPIPYYGLAAVLGLSLNTAAHLADVFRSGVGAIPVEQLESVRTLGADRRAAFRALVLPSALRTSFPAISTRLIHNFKNTALASFVAVPELFHEIQASITETFLATEFLVLAALIYLSLSWLLTLGLDLVDARLHRGRTTLAPATAGRRFPGTGSAGGGSGRG